MPQENIEVIGKLYEQHVGLGDFAVTEFLDPDIEFAGHGGALGALQGGWRKHLHRDLRCTVPGMKVLVTGMSGTGKSSALAELGRRGGGEYLWVEDRITELLALDAPRCLFVQGCVRNQGKFYDRFVSWWWRISSPSAGTWP